MHTRSLSLSLIVKVRESELACTLSQKDTTLLLVPWSFSRLDGPGSVHSMWSFYNRKGSWLIQQFSHLLQNTLWTVWEWWGEAYRVKSAGKLTTPPPPCSAKSLFWLRPFCLYPLVTLDQQRKSLNLLRGLCVLHLCKFCLLCLEDSWVKPSKVPQS